MKDGFILDVPHREGCFVVEAHNGEDFIVYDGMEYSRKRNGHHGGSTGFHRFQCNDPKCPARLLVRWDVLLGFVAEGVAGSPAEGEQG